VHDWIIFVTNKRKCYSSEKFSLFGTKQGLTFSPRPNQPGRVIAWALLAGYGKLPQAQCAAVPTTVPIADRVRWRCGGGAGCPAMRFLGRRQRRGRP